MKNMLILGAAAVLMSAAAPAAHAEKWVYYPVPGGAMGYDDDSRVVDGPTGRVSGDTLVYYQVPRAVGADAYSFLVRRIEFDCKGSTYQIRESAFFDPKGAPLGQTKDEESLTIVPNTTPAVFKRILCDRDRPPTARDVGSQGGLIAALIALPVTTALEAAPSPTASIEALLAKKVVASPATVAAPSLGTSVEAALASATAAQLPAPVQQQAVVAASPDAILTIVPKDRSNEVKAPEIAPGTGKVKKQKQSAGSLPMNPVLARIPRDERGKDSTYGK